MDQKWEGNIIEHMVWIIILISLRKQPTINNPLFQICPHASWGCKMKAVVIEILDVGLSRRYKIQSLWKQFSMNRSQGIFEK